MANELLIMYCITIGFLIFGIYLWYQIDSSIDYDILNNQFETNQTYVDSLDCNDIKLGINTLSRIWSPTQQDEVKELENNFRSISKERGC